MMDYGNAYRRNIGLFTEEQLACAHRVSTIDVFVRRNGALRFQRIEVLGEWQEQKDAVGLHVCVEFSDLLEQLCLRDSRRQFNRVGGHAHLPAGPRDSSKI